MIDQLHLLEKIGVIEDSFASIRMREIRNDLAHEYPLKFFIAVTNAINN